MQHCGFAMYKFIMEFYILNLHSQDYLFDKWGTEVFTSKQYLYIYGSAKYTGTIANQKEKFAMEHNEKSVFI